MKKKLFYDICLYGLIFAIAISAKPQTVQTSTDAGDEKKELVILMYHGFVQEGKESEYVLSVSKLEDDIVYLKENGYEFTDTYDLIDYVNGHRNLPKKCAMLTFDDGYLNNYTYAFPIIQKHGVKVVISPIAYYVEQHTLNGIHDPIYSQLTNKEIKEMHQSGLVDFQNHSYNMHSLTHRKGSSRMTHEKSEEYIREFYYDLKAAENVINDIIGTKTHAYIYPFGNISAESKHILKCCGYKLTLGCTEGINYISREPECLFMLRRYNRTPQKSARQILSQY